MRGPAEGHRERQTRAALLQQFENSLDRSYSLPISGSYDLFRNSSFFINDIRLRYTGELIFAISLSPGIKKDGELKTYTVYKRTDIFLSGHPVHADRQHLKGGLFFFKIGIEDLHGGHLVFTAFAPGGPKIYTDHLAPQGSEGVLLPVHIRECKVRGECASTHPDHRTPLPPHAPHDPYYD